MKRLIIALIVGIAVSAFAQDGATPERGKTVEKEDFPEALSGREVNVRLPLVRDALDALPEQGGFDRIYSINSQLGPVVRWKRLLTEEQVDFSNFQYIAPGTNEAEADLIQLIGGRIFQIGFFYPHLSSSKATSLISPFQDVGTNARADDHSFEVTKNGVRFRGQLVGQRSWSHTNVGQISINGVAGSSVPNVTQTGHYPVCVLVGIDPIDWYIKHHHVPPRIADALHSATLAKGMDEDEAELVLGKPSEVEHTQEDDLVTRVWNTQRLRESDGVTENVRLQADFRNGIVESFTDFAGQ